MNEKHIIREEDRATEICKTILKKHGIAYEEMDEIDCDECPGQNECIIAFIGRP